MAISKFSERAALMKQSLSEHRPSNQDYLPLINQLNEKMDEVFTELVTCIDTYDKNTLLKMDEL